MLEKIKKNFAKFKRKFLPIITANLGNFLLKVLLKTCKVKVSGIDHLHSSLEKDNVILMLWHNRLAPAVHLLRYLPPDVQCAALISKSRDGELLTALIEKYPKLRAIRVAHHSRHNALKETIETLNAKTRFIVVITPDGPRGPRYQIKPGIGAAAKNAEVPIIPLSWASTGFWQLKSWDKLIFPKPFSTIHFSFGEAIHPTNEEISSQISKWETILKDLDHAIAEDVEPNSNLWPK